MRSTRHYLRMNVSNVIVGEYMCQGRMPQSVRERYLKMKDAPDHPANLDVLIQNFDCALSHPDADDLERLRQAVRNSSF
jgi:flavodoxin I